MIRLTESGEFSAINSEPFKEPIEDVELEYFNLPVTLAGRMDNDGDYPTYDLLVDYTYVTDNQTIIEFVIEDELYEDLHEYPELKSQENKENFNDIFIKFMYDNFDDLFKKYEDKIYKRFKDDAIEDAQVNLDYDELNRPDWD